MDNEREAWIEQQVEILRVGLQLDPRVANAYKGLLRDAMAFADATRDTTCVAVPCPSCGTNVLVKAADAHPQQKAGALLVGDALMNTVLSAVQQKAAPASEKGE